MYMIQEKIMKIYQECFKSAGIFCFGVGILGLLTGCPPSESSPTTVTAPTWSQNLTVSSGAKGQFKVIEGTAAGADPLIIEYYWAGPGVDPPPSGEQAASSDDWLEAGWRKIESFGEPVVGLKTGGEYTVYAVAKNSAGFKRTYAKVTVGKPVGPEKWSTEPAVDQAALGRGQLLVTAGAVEGKGGEQLDPAADIRYYYAPSPANPPAEDKDQETDWTNSGWTSFTGGVQLTLPAKDYVVYATVSNNGGFLRFNFKDTAVTVPVRQPEWVTDPVVETDANPGAFTLIDGGMLGGNPFPQEVKYYYALEETRPIDKDIGDSDKWTTSPKRWKEITPENTVTNVSPASMNYHLYGVARNSEGTVLSNKVTFTVKGFSGWENVNSDNDSKDPSLSDAAVLEYDGDILIVGGTAGNTKQDTIWRGKFETTSSKWKWSALTNKMPHGISNHSAVKDENSNIFIIGGQLNSNTSSNQVWKGTPENDDFTWTTENDDLEWTEDRWPGRWGANVVYHEGSMYLMGGADTTIAYNDVWKSANGRNWTNLTLAANWTTRRDAATVSYDGRLWLLGGLSNNTERVNDVWHSAGSDADETGIVWERATNRAAWDDRDKLIAISFKDRIWLMGGRESSANNYLDVWYSADGVTWEESTKIKRGSFAQIDGAVVLDDTRVILRDNKSRKMVQASWIE